MKINKIHIVIGLLFLVSTTGYAQNISKLEKAIIGKWQLLSFERGNNKVDYSNRNIEWSFDGKKLSVMSDDLKGRIEGKYDFRRSIFRADATYILKCSALTKTHLPYGKLVVKSVNDYNLIMIDWEDEVSYTLKRISK